MPPPLLWIEIIFIKNNLLWSHCIRYEQCTQKWPKKKRKIIRPILMTPKNLAKCCQDTPILYGNTQRQMRGVFQHNFGCWFRFRAQNEDFVHFWPPKTPFWVKKWPYLNYFSIYSIGMHVAPLFKANQMYITNLHLFLQNIYLKTPKMTLLGPKKTPK